MRRHAGTLFLLVLFGVSTALLVCLLLHIAHDGALSLGAHIDSKATGPVFHASAIPFLAAISISTGYVLIVSLREYLHDRRLKRLNKSRND